MLELLGQYTERSQFFNLFNYITFRTGGAMFTAMIFAFAFGGPFIVWLRKKQGKGQPIREDGPQAHLLTKKGTPTMGGLIILIPAFNQNSLPRVSRALGPSPGGSPRNPSERKTGPLTVPWAAGLAWNSG